MTNQERRIMEKSFGKFPQKTINQFSKAFLQKKKIKQAVSNLLSLDSKRSQAKSPFKTEV